MKDSEFIALLNLYLDHEISPADAARLEAEVQNNPARRKIYQQYCRMQKACKMLASDFTTANEPVETAANRKVVAFTAAAAEAASARRQRMGNFYTVGTFAAAAACVAIIFVGRNRQAEADASVLAQQTAPAAITEVAVPVAPAVAARANSSEQKPVLVSSAVVQSGPRMLGNQAGQASATLVSDPLQLAGKARADALMAAALEQAKGQFAWIEAVQLAPIQQPVPLTDLRFETKPAPLRPEGRTLGGRSVSDANVELAALQFVK